MVLKRLLGSSATRSLTVLSVLAEAKRAFGHGNRMRALLFLGVAALAWKWALIGLVAGGLVKLLRGDRSTDSPPT